jgi:hypothetical protein
LIQNLPTYRLTVLLLIAGFSIASYLPALYNAADGPFSLAFQKLGPLSIRPLKRGCSPLSFSFSPLNDPLIQQLQGLSKSLGVSADSMHLYSDIFLVASLQPLENGLLLYQGHPRAHQRYLSFDHNGRGYLLCHPGTGAPRELLPQIISQ